MWASCGSQTNSCYHNNLYPGPSFAANKSVHTTQAVAAPGVTIPSPAQSRRNVSLRMFYLFKKRGKINVGNVVTFSISFLPVYVYVFFNVYHIFGFLHQPFQYTILNLLEKIGKTRYPWIMASAIHISFRKETKCCKLICNLTFKAINYCKQSSNYLKKC